MGKYIILNLKLLCWFILFVSCFFISGCEFLQKIKYNAFKTEKTYNAFVDHSFQAVIRKILIMPIKVGSSVTENSKKQLEEVVLTEISKLKYFEVISYQDLPKLVRFKLTDNIEKSTGLVFPVSLIEELGKTYQVDGVLFPKVLNTRPFSPMNLSYKHNLVHTASTRVVWTIDEQINMSQRDIALRAKRWYYARYGKEQNPSLKSEIMDISFDLFVRFSLSELFQTWRS